MQARRSGTGLIILGLLGLATSAHGDGVAFVMTSKSLPDATIAVIDPEGGSSAGGGNTDVRIAPGDIILFRFNFTPVPDKIIRGLQAYITEYLPSNTEVVGIRVLDEDGNATIPRYPGIAVDDRGRNNTFNSVPTSGGNVSMEGGTIAQLYADTGVFYTTDTQLLRDPGTQFITIDNGIVMNPQPQRVNDVSTLLGDPATPHAHNDWDWIQVQAFGVQSAVVGTNGGGNTPWRFGSAVAGPETFYHLAAREVGANIYLDGDPDDTDIQPTDLGVGPWRRVVYPGSTIGRGCSFDDAGSCTEPGTGELGRMLSDASTLGWDLTPANPLPSTATAVRLALGEGRVGQPQVVEIALRVNDTPLDGVQMEDVNCVEAFGGDTSAGGLNTRAKDNPWGVYLASPACVFLKLKYDVTVDKTLAISGDTLTYTIDGKNLSINDQDNVVAKIKYDSSRQSFISATGSPMQVPDCDGDGLACLVWDLGTLIPSEEFNFTAVLDIGGIGQNTNVVLGTYNSDDITNFTTQALTVVRPIGVVDLEMAPSFDPTATFATAGATTTLTGTVANIGVGTLTVDDLIIALPDTPAGWTQAGSMSYNCGTGPETQACSDDCSTNQPSYRLAETLDAGESCTFSVDVNIPGGASGLYEIQGALWANQAGFGGAYETWFRRAMFLNVGQRRSEPPTLDCPIQSSQTSFGGDSSENGGTARIYLNGIERGTPGAIASSRFDVGTFGPGSTFGQLYGGLEVRATAQDTGELESELSEPCFVTYVPPCADGLDNDGDGLIDFPADPGCASAGDNDETDVECSDGLDNDGDGDIDFPGDLECSSPNDTTEGGAPQCSDGVDNDGDGQVDGADPHCDSPSDRTEKDFGPCSDGIDNDMDGQIDFPNDPGCDSVMDTDEADPSPTPGEIRARLLFLFDSSGSMNWNTCTDEFTGGDGSTECAGADVDCGTCSAIGCGNGLADDSRLDKAKNGLSQVVAGFGEVEYGLMRFHQRALDFSCPGANPLNFQSGGWVGAGNDDGCGGGFNSGDLLVGFSQQNQSDLLSWMDGDSETSPGDPAAGCDLEIRGTGATPLAGSLMSAGDYLADTQATDTQAMCRPYVVILITDGAETCEGNPVTAAADLNMAGYTVYVVGFAVNDTTVQDQLNAIAAAGGGRSSAIFVSDENQLAAEISDIIDDTLLVEVCNGADDDCDTLIDEGVLNACGGCGAVPTETCNSMDDDCDGLFDEGTTNRCGTCGPEPAEACNLFDDDCDGATDEGGVCPCAAPTPERCDNEDNDCDGSIDENLSRSCGTDVGACVAGSEICVAGVWSMCDAVGPGPETCNNVDDDCDGIIDGLTRSCGSDVGNCQPGIERCTAGVWDTSVCIGEVGPSPELCNTLDDNCNGQIDEGTDPGTACGTSVGECTPGSLICSGGTLVCDGGSGPVDEICDNLDNDCDGRVDESVPVGAECGETRGECQPGRLTCVSGMFECIGAVGPREEICDGVDNNCDGAVDEGAPGAGEICGTDEGECDTGLTDCIMGEIQCTGTTGPFDESCNTLDDDCDGLIDEDDPMLGDDCGDNNMGECNFGELTCMAGALTCIGETGPIDEICDGRDNDCDGSIDEMNPEGGEACGDDTGECASGTTECVGGELVCQGAVGPQPEVCNGLDDDCDGEPDDGLPVGAPCGSDEGECAPGVNVCVDGEIVCQGETAPIPEDCDALDNDCDGAVDEELPAGEPCGEREGVCMVGMLQCVDGAEVCVGGVPAGAETCDCEDNDCDGAIDEDPDSGAICPGQSTCVDCQCALPCSGSEFGRCPTGRVEVDVEGECFCVAPRCSDETCGQETIERDGTVFCAPDTEGVPECQCIANECSFPCDGVICDEPTVCNPNNGRCVVDDCTGLGCGSDEVCEVATGDCIPHPCNDVTCGADEACRDGECETSCGSVMCGDGESCASGECFADPCQLMNCPAGERCDTAMGACVADLCANIMCPMGTTCDVDTGGCGEDPCARLVCPDEQRCIDGECEGLPMPPDAGMMTDDDAGVEEGVDAGEEPPVDNEVRILATGGGGCACRTADPRGSWVALLLLLVFGFRRQRNR